MTSAAITRTLTLPLVIRSISALALIALSSANPAPANAQAADPKASLELVSQTSWTINTPFDMTLAFATSTPADELDVAVTVYGAVRSRSQFQQSLEGRLPGTSLVLERQSLAEIRQSDTTMAVSLPVHDPSQRRFYLRDSGVYPVKIDLRERDGDVLDTLTTHIVRTIEPSVPEELAVATVLPLSAPVGRPDQSSLDLPDNGASIGAVIEAARQLPQSPISLLVAPETVERIAGNEESLELLPALAALPQTATIPMTTWSPVHTELFQPKYAGEIDRQFQRAAQQLQQVSPNQSTKTWFATESLDTRSLKALVERGYERFIVPESTMVAIRRDTTLTKPFALSPGRGEPTVPGLQADVGLSNHFTNTSQPVLAAHHLLADLAVLFNDRPAQRRSVVVMPPRDWRPDAAFLATYLSALETAPTLNSATVDQAFAVSPEQNGRSTLIRQFARGSQGELDGDDLLTARARAQGFSSMVMDDNPLPPELDRTLLQSHRPDLSNAERQTIRDRAGTLIDTQLALIDVPPERSLRLTARTGEIPISVLNETGFPISVRLRLTSDKLQFTNGGSRELPIERSRTTERFAIETKTTGAFPVEVVVESPDGALVVDRSRVTVRSTAASGVGVGLSVGAGLFLLLWWARSVIVGRRTTKANHPTGQT